VVLALFIQRLQDGGIGEHTRLMGLKSCAVTCRPERLEGAGIGFIPLAQVLLATLARIAGKSEVDSAPPAKNSGPRDGPCNASSAIRVTSFRAG